MGAFEDFNAPVFKNLTSAIRALAMDAVEKAKSGHPGMPMGMAEIAEVLWIHHLRHNPNYPWRIAIFWMSGSFGMKLSKILNIFN